ncbi:MAG TPA: PDZ domain-containing protein, partial [Bacteroidota bacterium]|nr:PDZ domain-containing protein [Bacteroidota bacterium]
DTKGCLVGGVNRDGPADKAGIKRGDVITKFNGSEVENSVQLRNLVAEAEPGSDANVMVLRDGKERDIVVKLGERPKNVAANGSGEPSQDKTSAEQFGLSVQELTASAEKALGFHNEQGVLVAAVKPESPADEAGIQKNDLIKEVNKARITSVSDFHKAFEHIGKHDSVALLIRRGDNTFYVALQVTS